MSTGMSMSDFDYRATLTFTLFIFVTFTQLKIIFTYYSHLDQGSASSGQWAKPVPCLVLSHFQMAEQISKGYYFMMWKLYAIQIAVSITKVLLPIRLCIIYGCFCAQKAGLISCNKDPTACNWPFTKKSLLISDLDGLSNSGAGLKTHWDDDDDNHHHHQQLVRKPNTHPEIPSGLSMSKPSVQHWW